MAEISLLKLPSGEFHWTSLMICQHWFRSLQWHHNGYDCISNHQPHDCLLSRLFRCKSQKTSKLRVAGLCEEKSPVTGEFSEQMACNAENYSIWWRHHEWLGAVSQFWPSHMLPYGISRPQWVNLLIRPLYTNNAVTMYSLYSVRET